MTSLEQLWEEQAAWSQKTFGSDASRGPIGSLKHLKLEADEAIDATNNPLHSFREEMADCLMLTIDAARRGGLTLECLIESARSKLIINKTRTYEKKPEGQICRHIEPLAQRHSLSFERVEEETEIG